MRLPQPYSIGVSTGESEPWGCPFGGGVARGLLDAMLLHSIPRPVTTCLPTSIGPLEIWERNHPKFPAMLSEATNKMFLPAVIESVSQ